VSALVEDAAEIVEMDLNPVKVLPPGQGCVVVDARILLQVSEEQTLATIWPPAKSGGQHCPQGGVQRPRE